MIGAGLFPGGSIATGLLAGLGIPKLFTTWQDSMQAASFRGAAFQVRSHALTGGRRGVVHQFPGKDLPVTEDLGSEAQTFEIDAYVVGDGYFAARNALYDAVFTKNGPGTLVHPWLGTLSVQVLTGCSVHESTDQGGMAIFRLRFVESGANPVSLSGSDTALGVLNGCGAIISALKFIYATSVFVAGHPGFLLNALVAGLGDVATNLLGLPVGAIQSVIFAASQIGASPTDSTATAAATAAAIDATAVATLAATPSAPDLTGGLLTLTGWVNILSPSTQNTPDLVQQAANASALTRLVQGCAVAAVAQIYAQTAFASATDALLARTQLLALIATQMDAAAAANDDGGFGSWCDLQAAVVTDLGRRALALPQRATYSFPAALPSLTLAQRLYADAAGADALDLLNGAMHPLFMPAAGIWLRAA